MENLEKLTNAIIIQAVKDYRLAYRKFLRNPGSREAEGEVHRQEKFFHSDWYGTLTELDGNVLLEKVRAMEREKLKPKEAERK